ncbi:hypothetical protein, partial [Legionella sp. S2E2]|uniref:hypothetical protein n=1 Tax=Legionella sp. S2E2 TaxID=3402815 RepID=UPI003AF4F7F2
ALAHRFVEPVLESSCTDVYTAVLRAVSPRAALTAASFARSLFLYATALVHRFVEPVLESSCIDVYTAVWAPSLLALLSLQRVSQDVYS